MIDIKTYVKDAEEKMELSLSFLDDALASIRAGKANPRLLDQIRINYYGSVVPLNNVATISTPDAKTISIQPWEKSLSKEIEKVLQNSQIGITPENNGEAILLRIPPLTEERRKMLVKQAKQETENAKMSVRNARRDAIDGLKKAIKEGLPEDMEKDGEAEVQKVHDRYIKKIDDIFAAKEKEILTV